VSFACGGFDLPDKDPSPIACPDCWRLTHYSLVSDLYVCPKCGPVITSETTDAILDGRGAQL
jgi:ribosomal protein L37AE/L43A